MENSCCHESEANKPVIPGWWGCHFLFSESLGANPSGMPVSNINFLLYLFLFFDLVALQYVNIPDPFDSLGAWFQVYSTSLSENCTEVRPAPNGCTTTANYVMIASAFSTCLSISGAIARLLPPTKEGLFSI